MTSRLTSLNRLANVLDIVSYFKNIFPYVSTFHFYQYKPHPGAAALLVRPGEIEPNLFAERKWQFEKLVIEKVRAPFNHDSLIENMLRHDTTETSRLIPVNTEHLEQWLSNSLNTIAEDEAIGWVSLCTKNDNTYCHIPMMDFSCDISPENQAFVKKTMSLLNGAGLLVNSGKSYHYYGDKVISPDEWHYFMTSCILLAPFTDVRYIAHRLLSGYSILRITPTKLKQQTPKIIDIIRH